jgi:general secretion pathway protein C
MDLLFKRYFWVLNTLLLIAAAFISARTLASYVKYEVLKPPLVEVAEEEDLSEDDEMVFRRPVASRSVDLRRRKELAEASKVEVEEPPEQPEPVEQVEPEQEEQEPEEVSGDIQLVLIATITVSDEAKNMALVSIDGGNNSWVGIGTELKPGFLVSSINNYYITVTQGVTELLWKKQEKPEPSAVLASGGRSGPPPRKTPEPRKTPTAPKAAPASKYADGIKQTGPFDYRLDRGMLNEQLQDLAKLGREARVIPNYDKESGTYKGFKLIGVRPNSLYRAIGIRSGDVIKQINGEELNSPGKALELFTKLQTSSSIMLDIDRRGKSQTMNYTIE